MIRINHNVRKNFCSIRHLGFLIFMIIEDFLVRHAGFLRIIKVKLIV